MPDAGDVDTANLLHHVSHKRATVKMEGVVASFPPNYSVGQVDPVPVVHYVVALNHPRRQRIAPPITGHAAFYPPIVSMNTFRRVSVSGEAMRPPPVILEHRPAQT